MSLKQGFEQEKHSFYRELISNRDILPKGEVIIINVNGKGLAALRDPDLLYENGRVYVITESGNGLYQVSSCGKEHVDIKYLRRNITRLTAVTEQDEIRQFYNYLAFLIGSEEIRRRHF